MNIHTHLSILFIPEVSDQDPIPFDLAFDLHGKEGKPQTQLNYAYGMKVPRKKGTGYVATYPLRMRTCGRAVCNNSVT